MHRFRRLATASLVAVAVVTFVASANAAQRPAVIRHQGSAGASTQRVEGTADFNGDGYADLAIGAPDEDLGTIANAGAVNVLYGSSSAPNILSSSEDQRWTQDSTGVRDTAESADRFGSALAWGDFDDDGYDDLVIGIKGEDVGSVSGAGAVAVLYGSAGGLTADGDQYFTQNSTEIEDTAEKGDNFGYAVAAGQFSYPLNPFCAGSNGGEDLAIGVRNEDLGSSKKNAGAVSVIYSDGDSLDGCGNQFWTQDSEDIEGNAEADDRFGSSLAVGAFQEVAVGLAIGVPEEDLGAAVDAGGLNVMMAYVGGLTSDNDEFWSQNTDGISDDAESGDFFGYALASTELADDPVAHGDDLVVGVYGEDSVVGEDSGAVHVLLGDGDGGVTEQSEHFLTPGGDQLEAGAEYGYSVAAGYHVGTGPVMVIGAPGDDLGVAGSSPDAGSVVIRYWSNDNPLAGTIWSQDSADIEDVAETGDGFGSALTWAGTSGTYGAMLAVGVPEEDVGTIVDAGAVNVMYGLQGDEIAANDDQFWTQDSEGVNDSAEASDSLGEAVA
jgi:hypothetical protein